MPRIRKIAPCLAPDEQAKGAAPSDVILTALLEMQKLDLAALARAAKR